MKTIGIIITILLGIIAYKVFVPQPLTRDECYRLGSNERTILCLQEVEKNNPRPTEIPLPEFQLHNLVLSTSSGTNRGINITIKNNDRYVAGNVIVKVVYVKSMKDNTPYDTEYFKFGEIAPSDVVTRTFISKYSGPFVYIASPYSAEYLRN